MSDEGDDERDDVVQFRSDLIIGELDMAQSHRDDLGGPKDGYQPWLSLTTLTTVIDRNLLIKWRAEVKLIFERTKEVEIKVIEQISGPRDQATLSLWHHWQLA